MTDSPRGAEFDLIERIRQRAITRDDVILGIGDDAAIVQVPPGRHLVVATDTLNAGVHFPAGTAPADIGWKALAVNLSDLAAMGAEPAWCTLSLSLPDGDAAWLDGFLDGFLALAARHRIALVGGDTTRGPLSISVTVHGLIEPGRVLRRDAAQVGDDLWISGTLGDAAGALALLSSGVAVDADRLSMLRARLDRPTPRIELGIALVGVAHACIDISDGLLADLGHICRASGVAAEVQVETLPASKPLSAAFDADTRLTLQATGGDDYELCFTAPVDARGRIANEFAAAVSRIGRIVPGAGIHAFNLDGRPWLPARTGYVHFEG